MDPVGLIAAAIAVFSFGSNFVPLKKYKTGDGMFFNFIMSLAILCVGMVVQVVECYKEAPDGTTKCPAFEPFAMVGGAIWATGNMLTPHIVKTIGLGLGMALWGSVNMLAGWATGKFGLFGLTPDSISNPGLNYAGVALSTMAIGVFLFIKPSVDGPKGGEGGLDEESAEGLLDDADKLSEGAEAVDGGDASWVDRLPSGAKRTFGILASVVAGVLYGANFTPPSWVAQHAGNGSFPGASSNLVDYVFPHFCGIFAANTFYFLVYAAMKRNKPQLFPEIVLPGFASGAMWALAQSCWFIANGRLSLSIAFPLIATGPGLIASLWGAFVFKEIQGKRNLMFLGAAFLLVIASAVTISLSK